MIKAPHFPKAEVRRFLKGAQSLIMQMFCIA
jgi:hypothetical protein